MQNHDAQDPSLKKIICSLILGADHPITPAEIQKILSLVEEERRNEEKDLPDITDEELAAAQADADREKPDENGAPPSDENGETPPLLELIRETPKICSVAAIKKVVADLQAEFNGLDSGIELIEISGGYRFQTSSDCGRWVRKMLNKGKPSRLARPAIETLAIIAYRQPVTRSEIESIRGVSAGHVIKALMEMQLVRIVGRSDLPGRPFLFGTTGSFLEHFGLNSLKELEAIKKYPFVSITWSFMKKMYRYALCLLISSFVIAGCEHDAGNPYGRLESPDRNKNDFVGTWSLTNSGNTWYIIFKSDMTWQISDTASAGNLRVYGQYQVSGNTCTGNMINPGVGEGRIDAAIGNNRIELDFVEYWHSPDKHVPYTGERVSN